MTIPEIQAFIDAHTWTFAKTMPQWPHEYVVKTRMNATGKKVFEKLVLYIREAGRDERFLEKLPVRQYLYFGGWKYWTMGFPLEVTRIINRAFVGPNPYDLIDSFRNADKADNPK